MKPYVGIGEGRARLAHAPQVHRHQHQDQHDATVASWPWRRAIADAAYCDGRRDRHRDSEDVVDEQRAGHRHPAFRPRLTVATS